MFITAYLNPERVYGWSIKNSPNGTWVSYMVMGSGSFSIKNYIPETTIQEILDKPNTARMNVRDHEFEIL